MSLAWAHRGHARCVHAMPYNDISRLEFAWSACGVQSVACACVRGACCAPSPSSMQSKQAPRPAVRRLRSAHPLLVRLPLHSSRRGPSPARRLTGGPNCCARERPSSLVTWNWEWNRPEWVPASPRNGVQVSLDDDKKRGKRCQRSPIKHSSGLRSAARRPRPSRLFSLSSTHLGQPRCATAGSSTGSTAGAWRLPPATDRGPWMASGTARLVAGLQLPRGTPWRKAGNGAGVGGARLRACALSPARDQDSSPGSHVGVKQASSKSRQGTGAGFAGLEGACDIGTSCPSRRSRIASRSHSDVKCVGTGWSLEFGCTQGGGPPGQVRPCSRLFAGSDVTRRQRRVAARRRLVVRPRTR